MSDANAHLSSHAAAQLARAREEYVAALRDLNRVRCQARGAVDFGALLDERQKRLAEATARWSAAFERMAGRRLPASGS